MTACPCTSQGRFPCHAVESTIPAATFARYAVLTADEHYSMQSRAYREAARSWAEYRSTEHRDLRNILRAEAESADAFYQEVTLALQARTRPELIAS